MPKKVFFAVPVIGCLMVSLCHAHFAWLKTEQADQGQQAVYYFSEGAHVDGDRMPDKISAGTVSVHYVDEKPQQLRVERVEQDGRVDMRAQLEDRPATVTARCDYGVYQGFLLTYFAEHLSCADTHKWESLTRTADHKLDLVVTRHDNTMFVTSLYNGKPWPGIEIELTDAQSQLQKKRTNQSGRVEFTLESPGFIGLRAHYVEDDEQGELDGTRYREAHYYSTFTVKWSTAQTAATTTESPAAETDASGNLPSLPEPIASFGAVVHGPYLYVYGGHIGREHQHSRDNLSPHFRRLDLKTGTWEELAKERPVQGLALVAHGNYIYRVGGMEARNAAGEPADMHSSSDFSRFDTTTGQWEKLPDLPGGGRSSHDAVVVGDKLYVVGGWMLDGEREGTWHESGLVVDLASSRLQWQSLPKQPTYRRALAVAAHDGKIYALCGINDTGEVQRSVDVWEIAQQTWTSGPPLPGEGMNGFGVSAWNLHGNLYVSGYNGVVYRLSEDGKSWEEAAHLETPRFFHRLVPYGNAGLLAVGGASKQGHISDIEQVSLGSSLQN